MMAYETPAHDVLVVDDSRIVREMVTDVLRAQGYAVRQAHDGRQALDRVAEKTPDLILLDVMMPELDGYEVCRRLRQMTDYVPVLMLTTKGALDDVVRGLEAGADDYVDKTCEHEELLARVRSLLRIRTLQKRLYSQNQELEAKNQQLEALTEQLDALNRELQLLSVTDGLTRAYNHRHFQERLKSEFARAKRYGEALSCVLIDLDHFKAVNDAWGHPVGDRVLVRLVEIFKEGMRGEDLVARYGGEEFALLLPRTPADHAVHLMERLRERVERERLNISRDLEVRCTISAGVAEYGSGSPIREAEELLQAADAALYRAKGNGRNRVEVA